jgi:hypothetical protein
MIVEKINKSVLDARWNTDIFDAGLAIVAQRLIQYRQIAEGRQGVCVFFAQQLFSKLHDRGSASP